MAKPASVLPAFARARKSNAGFVRDQRKQIGETAVSFAAIAYGLAFIHS